MTKITNVTPGPRGLHTKSGLVWVEGYQTVDAEFADDKQVKSAIDTGWFVKGERKAPGGDDGSDVASLKAEIERLTRINAALETENGELKAAVDAAKVPATGGYAVKETSSGWFAVTKGGETVTKNMRKDALAEFDTMSDEDKGAFVDLNKPE